MARQKGESLSLNRAAANFYRTICQLPSLFRHAVP